MALSIQKVDKIDLSGVDCRDVRAVLLPESPSAIYSLNLLNSAPRFAQKISLPSPINSSEDEAKELEVVLSCNASERRGSPQKLSRKGSKRKAPVILLKQSIDNEKFTFRTSNQSDVILKHDEKCNNSYDINRLHCHFYLDSDNKKLILCNQSTSAFSFQYLRILNNLTGIISSI